MIIDKSIHKLYLRHFPIGFRHEAPFPQPKPSRALALKAGRVLADFRRVDPLILIGLAITVIALMNGVPQPARIWRMKTASGISSSTQLLTLCLCSSWMLYGLLRNDVTQIITNIVGATAALLVLGGILNFGNRRTIRRLTPPTFIYLLALFGIAVQFGAVGVGTVAAVLSMTFKLPQAVLAWQKPGGDGVSITNFWMSLTCNGLWVAYGLLAGDPAVVVTAVWGFAINIFIIVRTMSARAHRSLLNAQIAVAS